MIQLVAVLTAHPGKRDALLARFKQLLPVVHAEDGCIEYFPTVDLDSSPDKFGSDAIVVIEKWETKAQLDAHGVAPHMSAFRADVKEIPAKAEIFMLREV